MIKWEEFRNRTPPHPNHVKHADRRSTGSRYYTMIQLRLITELFPIKYKRIGKEWN